MPLHAHSMNVHDPNNPSTPHEVIASLATHPELRQDLAWAPRVSAQILHELSADDDAEVLLRIAVNPSTSPSTLAALAGNETLRERYSTWELHREDVLSGLRDEESEARALPRPTTRDEAAATFVRALRVSTRDELGSMSPRSAAEVEFIHSVLVNDPSSRVRRSIAIFGDDVLRRHLVRDVVDDVVSAMTFHLTDPTLAEQLVGREPARLGLAANPVTPAHVLRQITRSSPGDFHDLLARHPHATAELLAEIVAAPSPRLDVRALVAQHPAVDVATLTLLSGSDSLGARQHVAAHRSTPPEVLAALADDEDAVVRLVVAMNRHTPPEVANRLASDPDVRVRQVVAARPGRSVAVWMRLAVDPDATVRLVAQRVTAPALGVLTAIARDPATDPVLLDALAADRRSAVRTAVAENAAATPAALDLLAGAEEAAIRLIVAKRADAPDAALERLATDPVWPVRRAAKSTARRRRRTR